MRPYNGDAETPLAITGTALKARWTDSVTVGLVSRVAGAVHMALVDVRTGAKRNELILTDSSVVDAARIAGGWAWIPPSRDRILVDQGGERREIKQPTWYGGLLSIIPDSASGRVFITGFNRATSDTLGVAAINLADGAATQWASMFAEDGTIQLLSGGDLFLAMHRTQESLDLFRISGPGKNQLLGSPARPLVGVSVSADLKRAVAFDRDYHADAWMYNVVRR